MTLAIELDNRSPNTPIRLSEFSLRDLISAGAGIRKLGATSKSLDDLCNRLVSYLHHTFAGNDGEPACALTRLFVTRRYADLPPELQALAATMVSEPIPSMKCLTLAASRGQRAEWNKIESSSGHRTIPLPNQESVQKIPMIAQLMRGLGVDVVSLLESDSSLVVENRHTGVFFVPQAYGSPYIPAQQGFVIPFGIQSVVGFGDVLPDGNMFAVICFSKVPISYKTAELLSHLSLSARVALLHHMDSLPNQLFEITRSHERMIENYEEIVSHQDSVLQMALQETRRANALKSDFLANMSHEIRTPMTAILGFSEMVLNDADTAAKPELSLDAMQTIHRNATHLLTVINDILDMSKIEAGKLQVERLPVDPVQIIEETLSLVRPQATAKKLELKVEYLTALPQRIQTDPTRLRQILTNLAGNAVKFTPQGSVTIRVHVNVTDESIRFDIVDSGIGMTEEQLAVVSRFELFSQADTSTTRRFGGTGLGLSVSNSLARLLGGSIEISSEFGRGSTFSVTIATGPLAMAALVSADSHAVQENANVEHEDSRGMPLAKPLLGMRILLVEDGPDNQRLFRYHLEKAGGNVTIVDNGKLAIELQDDMLANGSSFDLILMDMQMPVMDGYEATRALRRAGHSVRVIALTAHAMASDQAKCLSAGCDGYLTKPIVAEKLIGICLPVQ